jgi:hypothetical protein
MKLGGKVIIHIVPDSPTEDRQQESGTYVHDCINLKFEG